MVSMQTTRYLAAFIWLGLSTTLVHAKSDVKLSKKKNGPSSILIEFSTEGYQRTGSTSISAPGLTSLNIPGKPDLFTEGTTIVIPNNYEAVLSVVDRSSTRIANTTIAPFQTKYRCSPWRNKKPEIDRTLYKSKSVFPKQDVLIEDMGMMQDVELARIAFYPFRQSFSDKSLLVTKRVSVRIDFRKKRKNINKNYSNNTSYSFRKIIKNTTANGREILGLTNEILQENMLIISADNLVEALRPLYDWKRQKGIDVKLVSYTEAGGSLDAVKAYVQSYYNQSSPKLTYVLLAGAGSAMPAYRRSTSSGSAVSDYPFSLLSGSDSIPDVLLGRIVADNSAEAKVYVSKILNYEKNAEQGATWYKMGTTIASSEGYSPSDVDYVEVTQNILKENTYSDVDQFYEGRGTATGANISRAINEGRSWLTYIGHGSGTSWGSVNDSFGTSTIKRLQNSNRLPVIIDVACQNGDYVGIGTSFGEAWMKHKINGDDAGAVGYYGGSVNVSWDPPAIMSQGIAKYHFEKPVHNLGGSMLAGQIYLTEQMGINDSTIDNLEWYNLFGDPSLVMRTDAPKGYDVQYTTISNGLSVKIVDADGKGMEGMNLALNRGNSTTLVQTDANGTANLPLSKNLKGAVLTVTGYNTVTKQMAVSH